MPGRRFNPTRSDARGSDKQPRGRSRVVRRRPPSRPPAEQGGAPRRCSGARCRFDAAENGPRIDLTHRCTTARPHGVPATYVGLAPFPHTHKPRAKREEPNRATAGVGGPVVACHSGGRGREPTPSPAPTHHSKAARSPRSLHGPSPPPFPHTHKPRAKREAPNRATAGVGGPVVALPQRGKGPRGPLPKT